MSDHPGSGDAEEPPDLPPTRDVVEVWLSYAPGERIAGKYQLIRLLDQGGMGMIWVAHHLGLDVHVALKLVRPEVDTPSAAERLVIEAQAAARLRHPAIVQIIDVGRTAEGDPFLVMELLDGECLADVVEREGRIDPITALRVMVPIADALKTMHGKGVFHRDVKPDNIFLSRDDAGRWQPKLIDFGLARIDSRSRAGRITQRGAVVGTPVYLSPERIRGEDAGALDDVWALCVVLYVTITGELPFEGDNVLDVFVALAQGEPRSLAAHGIEDPSLWAILRRGLGPREGRWPSMAALERALTEELLRHGATRDISGSALRSTAIAPTAPAPTPAPPAPLAASTRAMSQGSRPGWQVLTTRMARPNLPGVVKRSTPPGPPAKLFSSTVEASPDGVASSPEPRPDAARLDTRDLVVSPEPEPLRESGAPPAPQHGARLTPPIALSLVTLGVVLGLIAGVIIGRQSSAAPVQPPGAPAGAR